MRTPRAGTWRPSTTNGLVTDTGLWRPSTNSGVVKSNVEGGAHVLCVVDDPFNRFGKVTTGTATWRDPQQKDANAEVSSRFVRNA